MNDSYYNRLGFVFSNISTMNTPRFLLSLEKCAKESMEEAVMYCFFVRDCRGGLGLRKLGRVGFEWLIEKKPKLMKKVVHLIPEYGRWDDLLILFPKILSGTDRLTQKIRDCRQYCLDLYVSQLQKDLVSMRKGGKCSYAAKWVPGKNDVCRKQIAKHMFPSSRNSMERLRKEVLTPLRKYMGIAETLICSGEKSVLWLPRGAYQKYKHILNVKPCLQGRSEMSAYKFPLLSMYPSGVLHLCESGYFGEREQRVWEYYEGLVKRSNSYVNSLCVVDVSPSMKSMNMYLVSIAFAILVSCSCENITFRDVVFPYMETFPVHVGNSGDINERFQRFSSIPWGSKPHLEYICEKVLEHAVSGEGCPPEKIYIITDTPPCESDDMRRSRLLYTRRGFTFPQIVYWNMSNTTDNAIKYVKQDMVIVNGYTESILVSMLLCQNWDNPEDVIRSVVAGERITAVQQAIIS